MGKSSNCYSDETLMAYLRQKILNESVPDVILYKSSHDVSHWLPPNENIKNWDQKTGYFFTKRPNDQGLSENGAWSCPKSMTNIGGNVPGFRKELHYNDNGSHNVSWIMHEYSIDPSVIAEAGLDESARQEALNTVICKVFRKDSSRCWLCCLVK